MAADFPLLVRLVDMSQLDVPWHWHEEVEFKYVKSGVLKLRTEKEEFILHSGDVCFTNTNIMETSEAFDKTKETLVTTIRKR